MKTASQIPLPVFRSIKNPPAEKLDVQPFFLSFFLFCHVSSSRCCLSDPAGRRGSVRALYCSLGLVFLFVCFFPSLSRFFFFLKCFLFIYFLNVLSAKTKTLITKKRKEVKAWYSAAVCKLNCYLKKKKKTSFFIIRLIGRKKDPLKSTIFTILVCF